ncbi:MAG: UDP-3-O-(3-hydroxymyristoyl)glucosamine N-acyltransferase [Bacteriovorax sp.]|nr:UDP-3-O-(3-hydroxymyristoyl)glucosamine N-acyltransferase [Bacteriovorax sp.]
MKLGNLKNFDSTLAIIIGEEEFTVVGITDSFQLAHHHFVFIKNKNFLNDWLEKNKTPKSTGVIFEKKFFDLMNEEIKSQVQDFAYFTAIVDDVNLAMSYLSKPFFEEKIKNVNDMVDGRQMGSAIVDSSAWIAQGVFIGESVSIHADVKIHPGVVIMSGVEVGIGSEIYPNTVIYRNVKIGKNVRIHANCSIGSDGFGYNFKNGEHLKVWHMGSAIIGDKVEIGANTSIDGGTFSPTIIGAGSKIDNLVQIGHNCRLGIGVVICGQAGLAGSCIVGDYTVMGGRAAIAPGVTIGKAVQIAGNAGVVSNVGDGEIVGGFPAREIKEWRKEVALIRKLSSANTVK